MTIRALVSLTIAFAAEVESICFYDSGSWTPGLTVPDGC